MTKIAMTRLALAACAVALAAPVAAQAQMYPPQFYPQPQPMYPQATQPLPPPAQLRVYTLEGSPVFTPGDEFGGAAAQNNRESRQYEALVRSNPSFRARRAAEECGSIQDPQGQNQCLSTFDYGER